MVSPIAATSEMKIKKYVGNKLNLILSGSKKTSYLVVGNKCCVQLKDNHSSIKIVGDNCTLQVLSGGGSVTYIGNNGIIYLDKSIDEDVVTYVGNNGLISSKSGTIQRHSSVDDMRKSDGSVKVIVLNGVCNISIPNIRTRVKNFAHTASTISLPNIQIQLSSRHDAKH